MSACGNLREASLVLTYKLVLGLIVKLFSVDSLNFTLWNLNSVH